MKPNILFATLAAVMLTPLALSGSAVAQISSSGVTTTVHPVNLPNQLNPPYDISGTGAVKICGREVFQMPITQHAGISATTEVVSGDWGAGDYDAGSQHDQFVNAGDAISVTAGDFSTTDPDAPPGTAPSTTTVFAVIYDCWTVNKGTKYADGSGQNVGNGQDTADADFIEPCVIKEWTDLTTNLKLEPVGEPPSGDAGKVKVK